MSRLIDADELKEKMLNTGWWDNADRDEVALPIVLNAPTIDIVRCKECIHLQKNGQCDKTHLWIGTKEDGGCDDFFCGYGERKTE